MDERRTTKKITLQSPFLKTKKTLLPQFKLNGYLISFSPVFFLEKKWSTKPNLPILLLYDYSTFVVDYLPFLSDF